MSMVITCLFRFLLVYTSPTDKLGSGRRIPCAFIVTGPNIASQGLLFEQLEESLLASMPSRFVRLRSADATNLKATLRKVVHDITAVAAAADEEEDDVGPAAATGVSVSS